MTSVQSIDYAAIAPPLVVAVGAVVVLLLDLVLGPRVARAVDPVPVVALFVLVAAGLLLWPLRHGTTDLSALPRSLYARAPRLGGLLAVAAVASLGLPGLAGFWGEFLSMQGVRRGPGAPHRLFYLGLLAAAALGTVLTAYYLLRMVRRVDQGDGSGPPVSDVTALEAVAWLPLAALVVVLGVLPTILLGWSVAPVELLLSVRP